MDKPVLGDYRIEGIVGVGRMGVVYLAIDRISGRAVALKVLREDVGFDPEYRARFRREGELLSQLTIRNIIPIHGVGEIDGELYIASRLVSSTLRNRILAGSLVGGRVDEGARQRRLRARRRARARASSIATSSPPTS